MREEWKCTQNHWLGKDPLKKREMNVLGPKQETEWILDPLIRGGICMALCYDWAIHALKDTMQTGDAFMSQPADLQRRISFQRSYDATWYDHGRTLPYAAFYQELAKASDQWFEQNTAHDAMHVETKVSGDSPAACLGEIAKIQKGEAMLLLISGTGEPDKTPVWGHVVGFAYPATLTPPGRRFFDPNQGQFTDDDALLTWNQVLGKLDIYPDNDLKIKNAVLYQFHKGVLAGAGEITDPSWSALRAAPDSIWDRTYHGLPVQKPACVVPCDKPSSNLFVGRLQLAVQQQGDIGKRSGLRVFVVGPDASQLDALLKATASVLGTLNGQGYRLRVASAIFNAAKPEVRLYYL